MWTGCGNVRQPGGKKCKTGDKGNPVAGPRVGVLSREAKELTGESAGISNVARLSCFLGVATKESSNSRAGLA